MEDVLDLYAEPDDEARPVVNFDEKSKQPVAGTRAVIPAAPGPPFALRPGRRGGRRGQERSRQALAERESPRRSGVAGSPTPCRSRASGTASSSR